MFRFVIACPATGRRVPLKMEMDRQTFLHSDFRNMRTLCPYCNDLHIWQKGDITLEPIRAMGPAH